MTGFKMSRTPAIDRFPVILFGCHQKGKYDEKCYCVAVSYTNKKNNMEIGQILIINHI